MRSEPLHPRLLVGLGIAAVLLAGGSAFAAFQLIDTDTRNGGGAGSAPGPSPTVSPAPEQSDEAGWRTAAREFGTAFTDTRGGHEAWLGRLEPVVSPALAEAYGYTDLSVVPDQQLERVTGGSPTEGETPARSVQLHYDGGLRVIATVSQAPETGRWVVTTAIPAEEGE